MNCRTLRDRGAVSFPTSFRPSTYHNDDTATGAPRPTIELELASNSRTSRILFCSVLQIRLSGTIEVRSVDSTPQSGEEWGRRLLAHTPNSATTTPKASRVSSTRALTCANCPHEHLHEAISLDSSSLILFLHAFDHAHVHRTLTQR